MYTSPRPLVPSTPQQLALLHPNMACYVNLLSRWNFSNRMFRTHRGKLPIASPTPETCPSYPAAAATPQRSRPSAPPNAQTWADSCFWTRVSFSTSLVPYKVRVCIRVCLTHLFVRDTLSFPSPHTQLTHPIPPPPLHPLPCGRAQQNGALPSISIAGIY